MTDAALFLANCALKSSIPLFAALIATAALQRRPAALRHAIWAAGIIACALMPLFIAVMPAWQSGLKLATLTRFSPPLSGAQESGIAAVESSSGVFSDGNAWQRAPVAMIAWLFGSALIAVLLIRQMMDLIWIAHRAQPFVAARWSVVANELQAGFRLKRAIRLIQSSRDSLLVTWGALRPCILVPPGAGNWQESRVRAVLGHELAHIRRHDWMVQLAGEITRIVFWFNPLVWLACSRMRLEAERACDDAVLRLGVASTEYAAELLDLARMLTTANCSWAPSLAMTRPSTLERRFAAMLNPLLDHRSISRKTVCLVAALTVCLTLPIAAMQAPIQEHSGRLFGRVYDPAGNPIKNATITVVDSATGVLDITTSSASGTFEFPRLPAGHYDVQTAATGFEPFEIRAVTVEQNQDVNLNILTVAAAAVVPGDKPLEPERFAPKVIQKVPPVYPATAKDERIQGTVILDAVIGTDGAPKSLRVVSSTVDPALAKAAVDAVKQWRYEPTLRNGQPVEVTTTIPVNFSIGIPVPSVNTPPPPPPPPPTPTRIRVGGNVQQSMLIDKVKPAYPQEAKLAGIQGVVILEAVIGRDGTIAELRALSGDPLLQQAALDAVRQWTYKPTLLNGKPVEVVTIITVNFSLQQ